MPFEFPAPSREVESEQITIQKKIKKIQEDLNKKQLEIQRIRQRYLQPWFTVEEYSQQLIDKQEKHRASSGAWTDLDRKLKSADSKLTTLDDPFGDVGKHLPQSEIRFEHDLEDVDTLKDVLGYARRMKDRGITKEDFDKNVKRYRELIEESKALQEELDRLKQNNR